MDVSINDDIAYTRMYRSWYPELRRGQFTLRCWFVLMAVVASVLAVRQAQGPYDNSLTVQRIHAVGGQAVCHRAFGSRTYSAVFFSSDVDDAFLEVLPPLPNCFRITLERTSVTPAGLEHLARQPDLKEIVVRDSDVPAIYDCSQFRTNHPRIKFSVDLSKTHCGCDWREVVKRFIL